MNTMLRLARDPALRAFLRELSLHAEVVREFEYASYKRGRDYGGGGYKPSLEQIERGLWPNNK